MLWHEPDEHPTYSQVVELDLDDVEPSLAGPRRPQDRVPLASAKESFIEALDTFGVDYTNGSHDKALADTFPASDPTTEQQPGGEPEPVRGCDAGARRARVERKSVPVRGEDYTLEHGSVVIAAITSCTNTSNPSVMIGAGLLAKKAVEQGLHAQAVGEVVARAGLEGRHRVLPPRRARARTSTSSASTSSATAARRASATRARCRTRSARRSPRASSSSAPCSPATATSRRASTPT